MTDRKDIRDQECAIRRERFRESILRDPELRKDLIVGLQNASPATWEEMNKK